MLSILCNVHNKYVPGSRRPHETAVAGVQITCGNNSSNFGGSPFNSFRETVLKGTRIQGTGSYAAIEPK